MTSELGRKVTEFEPHVYRWMVVPANLTPVSDNELHLGFYYKLIKQKQFKHGIWKHGDN